MGFYQVTITKNMSNLAAATKKVEELRLQLLEAECEVSEAEALEVAEKLQKARKVVEQAARKSKERAKLVKEDVKCEVEKEKQAEAAGDGLKGPVECFRCIRRGQVCVWPGYGRATRCFACQGTKYGCFSAGEQRKRWNFTRKRAFKSTEVVSHGSDAEVASPQNKKRKTAETNTA